MRSRLILMLALVCLAGILCGVGCALETGDIVITPSTEINIIAQQGQVVEQPEQPAPPSGGEQTLYADVALVVDSSGSMIENDPDDLRITAAKLFVDLADNEDQIAVVDFDRDIKIWALLSPVGGNRVLLKDAIDLVDSLGETNIGGGLFAGYTQLETRGIDSNRKAAVLLTDGFHNTGTDPRLVTPLYTKAEWPVYTVGLTGDADTELLSMIAEKTGGRYYPAPTSQALLDIYSRIKQIIKGQDQIESGGGTINAGQVIQNTIFVDNSVNIVEFTLIKQDIDVDYIIYAPDGTPVERDPSSPTGTTSPDITYISSDVYQIYQINNPVSGTWTYEINAGDVTQTTIYNQNIAVSSEVRINVTADSYQYTYSEEAGPEPVILIVQVFNGTVGVEGAEVGAEITLPDESVDTFTFEDQGEGQYGATYTGAVQEGIYQVVVNATADGVVRQESLEFEVVTIEEGPVVEPLQADFVADVTEGPAPLEVQFADTSAGEPTAWVWDFGDGNTSDEQNPAYTFTAPGAYTVTLTASTDTETDSASIEVTVSEPAVTPEVTPEETPEVTPEVTPEETPEVTPEMTPEETPEVTPEETPEVPPAIPLNASFAANVTEGFAPLSVQFNDTSSGDPVAWSWDFGDGNTSTERNATYTFAVPGLFPVTLTVENETGGEASAVQNTTVEAAPEETPEVTPEMTPEETPEVTPEETPEVPPAVPLNASFAANVTVGFAPLSVQFNDTSAGDPVAWTWDFGDGNTSAEQNATYDFAVPGIFPVTLTVENETGAEAIAVQEVTALVPPLNASFTAEPALGPVPLTVQFADLSSGFPVTWFWEFGDGVNDTAQNPEHEYPEEGVFQVNLTVENETGVNDTATGFIEVTT